MLLEMPKKGWKKGSDLFTTKHSPMLIQFFQAQTSTSLQTRPSPIPDKLPHLPAPPNPEPPMSPISATPAPLSRRFSVAPMMDRTDTSFTSRK